MPGGRTGGSCSGQTGTTVGDPLRSSSVTEDVCSLTAPRSLSAWLLLPTREMAAFQAVKGVIDWCCRSLPVSSSHWQEWDPRQGDSLTQWSPPILFTETIMSCCSAAGRWWSAWQGWGRVSEELGVLFLLARAVTSLSEVPGDARVGLWAQLGRAGCCRGLVQPGVRMDPAVTAAAAQTSVGETCGMLAWLHGFACAMLNTCRGFAGSAPEPEGWQRWYNHLPLLGGIPHGCAWWCWHKEVWIPHPVGARLNVIWLFIWFCINLNKSIQSEKQVTLGTRIFFSILCLLAGDLRLVLHTVF